MTTNVFRFLETQGVSHYPHTQTPDFHEKRGSPQHIKPRRAHPGSSVDSYTKTNHGPFDLYCCLGGFRNISRSGRGQRGGGGCRKHLGFSALGHLYGSCSRSRSRGCCGRGPCATGSRRFHLGWDHSRLLCCQHDVRRGCGQRGGGGCRKHSGCSTGCRCSWSVWDCYCSCGRHRSSSGVYDQLLWFPELRDSLLQFDHWASFTNIFLSYFLHSFLRKFLRKVYV